jgi:hypothetical protein
MLQNLDLPPPSPHIHVQVLPHQCLSVSGNAQFENVKNIYTADDLKKSTFNVINVRERHTINWIKLSLVVNVNKHYRRDKTPLPVIERDRFFYLYHTSC